jgi:hypothetical protein
MQIVETKHRKVIVPAGKYYLGDPCYAVPNSLWDKLLGSCNFFNNCVGEVNGHKVLAFNTAHGDGVYADQFENEFPVDAGIIGLVPEALIDMEEFQGNYPDMPGIWVKYDYETVCETDGKTLRFGKHRIETDSDE